MAKSDRSEKRQELAEQEKVVINALKDSGVLNFEQLGKVVSRVAPTVFEPGSVVADDYIVKGIESVIHIYKLRTALVGLEEVESIRAMATEVGSEVER